MVCFSAMKQDLRELALLNSSRNSKINPAPARKKIAKIIARKGWISTFFAEVAKAKQVGDLVLVAGTFVVDRPGQLRQARADDETEGSSNEDRSSSSDDSSSDDDSERNSDTDSVDPAQHAAKLEKSKEKNWEKLIKKFDHESAPRSDFAKTNVEIWLTPFVFYFLRMQRNYTKDIEVWADKDVQWSAFCGDLSQLKSQCELDSEKMTRIRRATATTIHAIASTSHASSLISLPQALRIRANRHSSGGTLTAPEVLRLRSFTGIVSLVHEVGVSSVVQMLVYNLSDKVVEIGKYYQRQLDNAGLVSSPSDSLPRAPRKTSGVWGSNAAANGCNKSSQESHFANRSLAMNSNAFDFFSSISQRQFFWTQSCAQ